MLYEKFIRIIEDHAEELTKEWIKEIKKNHSTAVYRKVGDAFLGVRVFDVYRRLGEGVLNVSPKDPKTTEHFIKLWRERAGEHLKKSEVIYVLILARIVLSRNILDHGYINSSIDRHQSLQFYQQANNFFDKSAYFFAVGFESIDKGVQGVMGWFIKKNN